MGYISNSKWHEGNPPMKDGAFVRQASVLRQQVTKEELAKNPSRFDLYISLACPWASRTLIFWKLKGLEDVIDVHIVDPYMGVDGWHFSEPEPNIGANFLRDLYFCTPDYEGRVTVPVLWDKQEGCIRNNESADIIAMMNHVWDDYAKYPDLDLIPEDQKEEIEGLNEWIYEHINNGVYRTGFAQDQSIYESECRGLFQALDELELRLQATDYLLGDALLEPDIRLFVTLIRFDWVYVGHFKCNLRRIADYPNLSRYVKRIYDQVKDTVSKDHIKRHYYESHPWINPNQIVPIGPETDYSK